MEDEEEIILTEAAEELARQQSAAEPTGDDGSDVGPLGLNNGQLHEIRLGDDIFDDDEAMVVRTDVPESEENRTSFWQILKTHVIYIQCYFVTIACILGTGILGLPVTLAQAGFYPFVVSFLIGFVMQVLLIYFFTDLLQRAHAYQIEKHKAVSVEEVQLPLREINDNDSEDGSIDTANGETGGRTYRHAMPTIEDIQRPNLHMLGTLFLGPGWRQLFDIILLLQFVFILISYALAGSEAYAQVLNVEYLYIIPVFVWILSISIVFAQHVIQPLISILTLAKGGILVATVVVTFGVGAAVANEIKNNFQYMGQPFLMGTVALGGIMNVMPLMYSRIDFVKTQIRAFMLAVLAGLTTCMILNVLWCWSVLGIVPQTSTCDVVQVVEVGFESVNNTSIVTYKPVSNSPVDCSQELSLERSEKRGEIATIPLTEIINTDYPKYTWVAVLIQTFIMLSVSVSFLTMGSALMHSFLGWLDAQMLWERLGRQNLLPLELKCCTPKVWRPAMCLLLFGIVFAVAMLDPKGFVVLLDKISSLLLNLEGGVFVYFMVRKSRSQMYSNLKIPLPVIRLVYPAHFVLLFYFTFAVVYDVVLTLIVILT
ncbi:uncharacterized protein [Amphiura filiformis]|uniref:uncharacterized protein n=1 Tax=Amphiura filiformis TaxID=82378 RepID=UPI003B216C56